MLEKQNEDCQNLNIWAPRTLNGEKKAVFVFIHGGGFFAGNAFEEISFDGFNMAHNSDVIFVSINHRLNIMGHLNLEEYGKEFWNSANVGIADLVVALKWKMCIRDRADAEPRGAADHPLFAPWSDWFG